MEDSPNGGFIVNHKNESPLVVEVKSKQHLDQPLMDLKESVLGKLYQSFTLGGDGVLRYQGRLCVPNVYALRNRQFWRKLMGPVTPLLHVRQRCTITLGKCFGGKV